MKWVFHLWRRHGQWNRQAPRLFVQENDSYATLNFSQTFADCFLFKRKRQWCNLSTALLRRRQHKKVQDRGRKRAGTAHQPTNEEDSLGSKAVSVTYFSLELLCVKQGAKQHKGFSVWSTVMWVHQTDWRLTSQFCSMVYDVDDVVRGSLYPRRLLNIFWVCLYIASAGDAMFIKWRKTPAALITPISYYRSPLLQKKEKN